MLINQNDIADMDNRYRVHFINCLSGYKSANLIGTQDKSGQLNVSIISSLFHLGANPALMGMIIRPRAVTRHTFDNLSESGFYTVNHVSNSIYQQAHQTSARYEKHQSEFDMVGFEPEYLADFPAPFVKQSQLKIGLKLVETQTLQVNDTELVIGEVICVQVADEAVQKDGFIDLSVLNTSAVNGLDGYCSAALLNRLEYAKPDLPVRILKPE